MSLGSGRPSRIFSGAVVLSLPYVDRGLLARADGLEHLLRYISVEVGRPLIDAADAEQLEARLSTAVAGPVLSSFIELMIEWFERHGAPTQRVSESFAIDRCPIDARPWIKGAIAHSNLIIDALCGMLSASPSHLPPLGAPPKPGKTEPLAFLYDPDVPAAAAKGIYGGLCASACIVALYCPLLGSRQVPTAIAKHLARRLVEGEMEYLQLLASVPQASVPDTVVRPDERIDLARLAEDARRARDDLDSRLEAQRSNPAPVVFLYGQPVLEASDD